jgi:hypothetical protein
MDNEYTYMKVANARRALLRILRIGGSAGLRVGDEFRVLQHFPSFDRPQMRLPWPLSRFQPFSFTIRWSKATPIQTIDGIPVPPKAFRLPEEEIDEKTFDRTSLKEGLAFFLRDANPEDEISVTYLPNS